MQVLSLFIKLLPANVSSVLHLKNHFLYFVWPNTSLGAMGTLIDLNRKWSSTLAYINPIRFFTILLNIPPHPQIDTFDLVIRYI